MASNKEKKCGTNSTEKAKHASDLKISINKNANLANFKKIEDGIEYYECPNCKDVIKIEKRYYCSCCGKSYSKQKGNFSASKSPLYEGNGGYVTICKDCMIKYYRMLVEVFNGNEAHAIERMCQLFDWLFHENPLGASREISEDRPRITDYVNKIYMSQSQKYGITYLDTIKLKVENESKAVLTDEELNNLDESEAKRKKKNILRWGIGYDDLEYDMLNEHYKLYKDSINENDSSQVTLLNSLCEQNVLKNRALRDKNYDMYDKFSKLYQQTLTNANLKVKGKSDVGLNNPDDCWGNFNKIIETMTPSEYFKDKKIFKDADEQDEYYRRFVERPTNNLRNGTVDMDEEFSIKGDEDDEL